MNKIITYKLVLIISLITCISCNKRDAKELDRSVKIDLNYGTTLPIISGDSIFESAEYILLEGNPESMIGGIDDMKIIDSLIYVYDRKQCAIFRFDMTGRYIDKLKKRGRGAGEYLNIEDFEIGDEHIIILDRATKKILFYSSNDLTYIKSVKLSGNYSKFNILGSYAVMYGNFQTEYNVDIIDLNSGALVADPYKKIPKAQIGLGFRDDPFFYYQDILYATFKYEYSIYRLDLTGCSIVLNVDFGNNAFSKKLMEVSSDERRQLYPIDKPQPVPDISDLIIYNDYYIFMFIFNQMKHTVIYNTKNSTYSMGVVGGGEVFPLLVLGQGYWGIIEDKVIYSVGLEYLIHCKDEDETMPEELKHIETFENPVIALYKLKI